MAAPEELADVAAGTRSLGSTMVRGTLVQQASLPAGIVTGLVVTTALARSLSLAEFGLYGFVVALASYLYFVIGTAETAAVNDMAAAGDRRALEHAFTRAAVVYAGLALVAGLLIAVIGVALVSVLDFSPALTAQGRAGACAVGASTAVGWTTKVYQDYLRATHRFGAASAAEAIGATLMCAAVVIVLTLDAPLWTLIAAGGSLPLYVGGTAAVIVVATRTSCRLGFGEVTLGELVEFARFSGGLLIIASSDFVVSSLDRTVVGVFRPPPTLGLYEAASRLNVLVRVWVGNLSVTLLPVLSRTRAADDTERERDLLVAGIRYMLVASVGPTLTLMMLSDRLLTAWLGQRYAAAAPTTVVFLAWWLLAPNFTGAATLAIVSRRLRQMAIAGWTTAAVNLVVSVALTAWLGLIGVAIGTLVGYVAVSPYFVSFAFAGRGVSVKEVARVAWLPAYGLGAVLAAALLVVRVAFPLDHLWSVVVVIGVSVCAYWGAFLAVATDPGERALLRSAFAR